MAVGRAAHWIFRAAACCSICGSGRSRCRALAHAPFAPPPSAPKLRISSGRRVSIPGNGPATPEADPMEFRRGRQRGNSPAPRPMPPALSPFRVFGCGGALRYIAADNRRVRCEQTAISPPDTNRGRPLQMKTPQCLAGGASGSISLHGIRACLAGRLIGFLHLMEPRRLMDVGACVLPTTPGEGVAEPCPGIDTTLPDEVRN